MPKKNDKKPLATELTGRPPKDLESIIYGIAEQMMAPPEPDPEREALFAQRQQDYQDLRNERTQARDTANKTQAFTGIVQALSGLGYLGGTKAGDAAMRTAREGGDRMMAQQRQLAADQYASGRGLLADEDRFLQMDKPAHGPDYSKALSPLLALQNMDMRREAEAHKDQRSQANLGIRREALEETKNNRNIGRKIRFNDKVDKDPVIKELRIAEAAFGRLPALFNEAQGGNTTAFAGVGAMLARAWGERGVLTEEDVARYARSGKWSQQTLDKANKLLTGRPTDATIDELKAVTEVVQGRLREEMGRIESKMIYEQAAVEGTSPEDMAASVGRPYGAGWAEQSYTPEVRSTLSGPAGQPMQPGGAPAPTTSPVPSGGLLDAIRAEKARRGR